MVVTVVGVGALGSHVALFLRNEADLRVVDMDRVESKNVLSQFHAVTGVGKKKVDSLRAVMQMLFGVKPGTVGNELREDNAEVILNGSALIIDCLDNVKSRETIQRYASVVGAPCLHGALAANGEFGRVCWNDNFVADDEGGEGTPTCTGGEHLPFIAIVSGYVASAAQAFLRSGKKVGYMVYPSGSTKV